MRMEKRRILKEDGRYLIYYHFPESANAEQTAAFEAADEAPAEWEAQSAAIRQRRAAQAEAPKEA